MDMRRAVITGLGIVSSIGNDKNEVLASLKEGRSGISFAQEQHDLGFRSQVHGAPDIDLEERIDRKLRRFMGDGAAYNYIAMAEAVADSKLTDDDISNERTGLIMGSGGPSTRNLSGHPPCTRRPSGRSTRRSPVSRLSARELHSRTARLSQPARILSL